jgi:hypothetical protein
MPRRNGSGIELLADLTRRQIIACIEPKRLGQIEAWLAGTEVGRTYPPTHPQ